MQPDQEMTMQKQYKQIRLFDGSASTIKKVPKPIKCQPLEERQVVQDFGVEGIGSKAENVFNSRTDRFNKNSYLTIQNNPGPQDYDAHTKEPQYMIKGPVDTKFGSVAERTSLLQRDMSKSPFKNPTSLDNPSPSAYKVKHHEMSKDFSGNIKSIPSPRFKHQQSNDTLNEPSIDIDNSKSAKP